ncbi:single-strand DNA-binding protein [Klenkia marina]|uniref:Single-strand DNA-binding protein n=1 Tax=Klenkia marina TaxID=1960309 RepID=A0A1G4YKK1_9ACTN|nr:single-stranded DNA-binding protein [Klenkia marina]SCX54020.1 single-strand DNA-binding protein [Klenkia marina]
MTSPTRPTTRSGAHGTDRNDVVLRGRLAAPAVVRELPSGDTLLVFKLTVRRPAPRPREPGHDTITCVSSAAGPVRRAASWHPGDLLEVQGSLRRRYWRSPTGGAVVHEVECRRARRCRPTGPAPS